MPAAGIDFLNGPDLNGGSMGAIDFGRCICMDIHIEFILGMVAFCGFVLTDWGAF